MDKVNSSVIEYNRVLNVSSVFKIEKCFNEDLKTFVL